MKKSFFGALLLFVLAACSPRVETLVILSTNDIHSHIENFPQLAAAVKACRDTVKNVILVDAGDRWTGNVYCDRRAAQADHRPDEQVEVRCGDLRQP